jgi:t-SNARE complex subunit (syntaxin)
MTAPKWMLEQEIQRRLDDYDADEKELQARIEEARKAKVQRAKELKDRARYARKKQVRL